jgi:copper resistance protein B
MPIMKPDILTFVGFDELEYFATGDDRALEYDGDFWIGGDLHRAWFRARGEQLTDEGVGDVEFQALYSRAVASFWNVQGGLRVDGRYGEGSNGARAQLAFGLTGLAPYWFELEAFGFLSQDGALSARLEASHEFLITQRLIVESEFESVVSTRSAPEWGERNGVNDVELGARMRYEFKREFAPYVGYSWTRRFGEISDAARLRGGPASQGVVVLGLHWWW